MIGYWVEVDSINRIRLEFKVIIGSSRFSLILVLIESDWNLKLFDSLKNKLIGYSINRIRLEFKAESNINHS